MFVDANALYQNIIVTLKQITKSSDREAARAQVDRMMEIVQAFGKDHTTNLKSFIKALKTEELFKDSEPFIDMRKALEGARGAESATRQGKKKQSTWIERTAQATLLSFSAMAAYTGVTHSLDASHKQNEIDRRNEALETMKEEAQKRILPENFQTPRNEEENLFVQQQRLIDKRIKETEQKRDEVAEDGRFKWGPEMRDIYDRTIESSKAYKKATLDAYNSRISLQETIREIDYNATTRDLRSEKLDDWKYASFAFIAMSAVSAGLAITNASLGYKKPQNKKVQIEIDKLVQDTLDMALSKLEKRPAVEVG